MNHSYRVERLCIGHCEQGDASTLPEKAVLKAFTTLAMGLEQLFGSIPMPILNVSLRYTQDGLDVRLNSVQDSRTLRNLLASVVSDVNLANPGLHLSVITRLETAAAPQRFAALPLEQASGFTLAAPGAQSAFVPALHGVADSGRQPIAA